MIVQIISVERIFLVKIEKGKESNVHKCFKDKMVKKVSEYDQEIPYLHVIKNQMKNWTWFWWVLSLCSFVGKGGWLSGI